MAELARVGQARHPLVRSGRPGTSPGSARGRPARTAAPAGPEVVSRSISPRRARSRCSSRPRVDEAGERRAVLGGARRIGVLVDRGRSRPRRTAPSRRRRRRVGERDLDAARRPAGRTPRPPPRGRDRDGVDALGDERRSRCRRRRPRAPTAGREARPVVGHRAASAGRVVGVGAGDHAQHRGARRRRVRVIGPIWSSDCDEREDAGAAHPAPGRLEAGERRSWSRESGSSRRCPSPARRSKGPPRSPRPSPTTTRRTSARVHGLSGGGMAGMVVGERALGHLQLAQDHRARRASRRRRSRPGRAPAGDGSSCRPRSGTPAVLQRSFTAIGTPCSGPR